MLIETAEGREKWGGGGGGGVHKRMKEKDAERGFQALLTGTESQI